MEQNENTLSVLKIAPGQYPQQVEIDNDLKALQQAVGGSIGASYPFADPVAIVYNDDGKLMGLPLNRALRDEDGQMYDAVAGDFLVVGLCLSQRLNRLDIGKAKSPLPPADGFIRHMNLFRKLCLRHLFLFSHSGNKPPELFRFHVVSLPPAVPAPSHVAQRSVFTVSE